MLKTYVRIQYLTSLFLDLKPDVTKNVFLLLMGYDKVLVFIKQGFLSISSLHINIILFY